ncbi:MAG: hypothetical protein AVDCRST_MAG01-01-741, partial [uncultured Rubrobacteraceae bacterium]
EDTVHQRPGGAGTPRAELELLRARGGGGHLLRRPPLRLLGVRGHVPWRPALLRARQPRPSPRQPGVPRGLHPPRRQGTRGWNRGGAGNFCRPLRLADVLRRPQPVHGGPDGPPGTVVVGEHSETPAPRPPGADRLRHPLPALRARRSQGPGPRGLRVFPEAHRPPRAKALAARARPPLRPGPAEGDEPGRDEGVERLRAPYFGGV